MVLGQKTKLFLGKDLAFHTKTMFFQGGGKTQKHIFLDFGSIDSQRSAFFCFALWEIGFPVQNHLFLRKSWYFSPTPTFSQRKQKNESWYFSPKPTFSQRKQQIESLLFYWFLLVSLRKSWFWIGRAVLPWSEGCRRTWTSCLARPIDMWVWVW